MRIGWIDYKNTIPFYEAVNDKNGKVLVKGNPALLNRLIRLGEIDVGIISSAEYIENFSHYYIIPNLSISSYGRVHSVVLVSDEEVEHLENIVLSEESKTSNLLLKVISKEFWKKEIIFLDKKSTTGRTGYLFIGDKALKNKGRYRYVIDLSEEWYKYTGLPFVFALWCVREEFYRKKPETVKDFYKKLIKSVRGYKNQHLDEETKLYLNNLDFSLKEEHIESLKKFSYFLKKYSFIKKTPYFKFLEE